MKKGKPVVPNPYKSTNEKQPILVTSTEEEWLNIQDLMAYLKMSRRSINRLAQQNEIPSTKLGGTLMFPKNLMNKIMLQNALKQMDKASSDPDNLEA